MPKSINGLKARNYFETTKPKIAVIRLLSGFPVLLASLTAYVRINPRNLLACGYTLSIQSGVASRIPANMKSPDHPKAHPAQRHGDRPRTANEGLYVHKTQCHDSARFSPAYGFEVLLGPLTA